MLTKLQKNIDAWWIYLLTSFVCIQTFGFLESVYGTNDSQNNDEEEDVE